MHFNKFCGNADYSVPFSREKQNNGKELIITIIYLLLSYRYSHLYFSSQLHHQPIFPEREFLRILAFHLYALLSSKSLALSISARRMYIVSVYRCDCRI